LCKKLRPFVIDKSAVCLYGKVNLSVMSVILLGKFNKASVKIQAAQSRLSALERVRAQRKTTVERFFYEVFRRFK